MEVTKETGHSLRIRDDKTHGADDEDETKVEGSKPKSLIIGQITE